MGQIGVNLGYLVLITIVAMSVCILIDYFSS